MAGFVAGFSGTGQCVAVVVVVDQLLSACYPSEPASGQTNLPGKESLSCLPNRAIETIDMARCTCMALERVVLLLLNLSSVLSFRVLFTLFTALIGAFKRGSSRRWAATARTSSRSFLSIAEPLLERAKSDTLELVCLSFTFEVIITRTGCASASVR